MHSSRRRPARSARSARSRWLVPGASAVAVIALAGCSGGHKAAGSTGSSDSAALLASARSTLAAADTVHFTLTSSNVPGTGTRLVAGEGVVARPKQFQGTLTIQLGGSKVSVDLISAKGKVYVKLPFSSGFQVADPAQFGLSDPANLIDANTGIARMFGELTGVSNQGRLRIGNDVVTRIDGSLPGSLVADLLTDADPSRPVSAELFVTTTSHQLRRVVLTGPFYAKGQNSTFNLLLDQYGATVSITPPPTS